MKATGIRSGYPSGIYESHPWLYCVFPRRNVVFAEGRICNSIMLEICTRTETVTLPHFLCPIFSINSIISAYIVDEEVGLLYRVGVRIEKNNFPFYGSERQIFFEETVENAIRKLPRESTATHVVVVSHTMPTTLFIFEPPKVWMSLRQWYISHSLATK